MNVEYINPFVAAVKNVFDTMIELPFSIEKPRLKKGSATVYDINSVIDISGEIEGKVVVSFPRTTALIVASTLLGEAVNDAEASCTDAIGEIANMVAGDAKNDFQEKSTTLSVPDILIGSDHVVFPEGLPVISIPCQTEGGQFIIEVAIQ